MTAARQLVQLGVNAEVVLVEQRGYFMSCPISNLFLAGIKPLEFLVFDYTNVVKDGVIFVQDRVLEINRDRRLVRTTGGICPTTSWSWPRGSSTCTRPSRATRR